MTRETKFNLAFLTLILALLGPGGVLLFFSRLKPNIKPLTDPDPMPHTVAFISPGQTPPGMVRVYPPHTAAWVNQLMDQHGASDIKLAKDDRQQPMVSQKRSFQLLGVRRYPTATTILVLVWNQLNLGSTPHWTLDAGGASHVPQAIQTEPIAIPDLVQKELGANQILILPKQVEWVQMTFPTLPNDRWTLHRALANAKEDQIIFVPPFTNPIPSRN